MEEFETQFTSVWSTSDPSDTAPQGSMPNSIDHQLTEMNKKMLRQLRGKSKLADTVERAVPRRKRIASTAHRPAQKPSFHVPAPH